MPEHLRALVVILALAIVVFAFAKPAACAIAVSTSDFVWRRNTWFAITLIAFLAHSFWVFIIGAAAMLLVASLRETNRLALMFFVLLGAPDIGEQIAGVAGIRHFFTVGYIRLLALAVLLPVYLSLRRQSDAERFGRSVPDKLLLLYLILNFGLVFVASSFTGALRQGVFYAFTDVFLPYYVASRSLKNVQDLRDALMSFAVATLVLAAIAIFEFTQHWLLYSPLQDAFGMHWGYGLYLERGEETGMLRAQGPTGQPIPLGFAFAVAFGLWLYLKTVVPNRIVWILGLLLICMGLIASVSRGPWIGAAITLLVFVLLDRAPGKKLLSMLVAGTVVAGLVLVSPFAEKIVDYLPFVGSVDEGSVTYRQRLFEIATEVILQRPLFGAFDFMLSPAMQELKQGQGIIDIVNSYLGIGLASGLVGLSLFVGFFLFVLMSLFRALRSVGGRDRELYALGQALFAVIVGILVIIATVSSISVIPLIYWSLAGLAMAYARTVCRVGSIKTVPSAELAIKVGY